jgi:hypothetical protein
MDNISSRKEESIRKTYVITPKLTKSCYDIETWSSTLKNGKNVDLNVTSYWRWGEFNIELSDTEYNNVKNQDTIVVSDYDHEFISSVDCRCNDHEIINFESYTEAEREEIENMLETYDEETGENLDFNEILENNWISGDVKYVIVDGCILE